LVPAGGDGGDRSVRRAARPADGDGGQNDDQNHGRNDDRSNDNHADHVSVTVRLVGFGRAAELVDPGAVATSDPESPAFESSGAGHLRRIVSGADLEAGFPALGTTAVVLIAEDGDECGIAVVALDAVRRVIDEVDQACSRFRLDAELRALNAAAGGPFEVSPTLFEAVDQACRAAELTDGLVDPTLGGELRQLGYDRDFAVVAPHGPPLVVSVRRRGNWTAVGLDAERQTITVPQGVELDLGATAKAWCADRAARAAFEATGVGVLVGLGGDIAVMGPPPPDGWSVRVADDHAADASAPGEVVLITAGGLATSSTTVRRWSRGIEDLHHVLDPTSGRPATVWWRTASVAAASCLDANIATTASILLGRSAPQWLIDRGLPARLVRRDGTVVTVGGWPTDEPGPDDGAPSC
jgi:thiamine biosynthesis lipoprotein